MGVGLLKFQKDEIREKRVFNFFNTNISLNNYFLLIQQNMFNSLISFIQFLRSRNTDPVTAFLVKYHSSLAKNIRRIVPTFIILPEPDQKQNKKNSNSVDYRFLYLIAVISGL